MKITKDTMLAYVNGKTDEVVEVLATGEDVETLLAGSVRAQPVYGMGASHVTNTTRKYQCNADLRYAKVIKEIRKEVGATTDGAVIRMILEAGLKYLGHGGLVKEVEAERDASEVES